MKDVHCYICNSPAAVPFFNHGIYYEGGFQILRCNNCGTIFTYPQPVNDELKNYYLSGEYYSYGELHSLARGKAGWSYSLKAKIWQRLLQGNRDIVAKLFNRRLGGIPKNLRPGRILDVGCGDGFFLYQMKKIGWDTYGTEVDKAAVERANMFGLKVSFGGLPATNYENKYFNVVRLWHVLEHIPEPMETLKKIRDLLKDDGEVIIGVPNADSLSARIFRRRWCGWDMPRHLYHYNTESLSRVLDMVSLRIVEVNYKSVGTFAPSFLNYFKSNSKKIMALLLINPFSRFFFLVLDILIDVSAFGDCIEVRAVKSDQ